MVRLNDLEPPSPQSHFLFAKKMVLSQMTWTHQIFQEVTGICFFYPTRELVSVFYPNRTHLNNYVLFDTFTVDVIACLKWLGLTKSFEKSQGIVVCFLSNNYYHLKQLCFNTFTVDVIASLCPAQPLCVRPSNWDDANKFQWKWLVFVAPCIQG